MKQRRNRTLGQLVKLAGHALAIDTAPTSLSVDPGNMTVTGVISAETRDRENDIVLAAGVDLSDHARNPVVMLDHGLTGYTLAVAKAEDPSGLYAVRPAEGLLEATTFFTNKSQVSEQVFSLYDAKIMRAFSIGFIPKSLKRLPANPDNPLARPGFLVEACLLTEYSCCAVGCNGDALTVAYEKNLLAGRQLHPLIRKSLTPFVLPRKRSVNGAALNPGTKTMADQPADTPPAPDDLIKDIPAVEEIATTEDTRPPGARFLDGYFRTLLQASECLDAGRTSQEHPPVTKLIGQELSDLQDKLQAIADLYAAEYPDLEPLAVPEPPRTEETPESDPDEGEPGEKNKRFTSPRTKAFTKAAASCIKSAAEMMHEAADMETLPKGYRKGMHATADELSGLVKDAGDPAEDTSVSKADYEKLLKNFQTLETNHKNLVARVQRAVNR